MLKLVAPDQYVVKFLRYSDASNLLNSKSKLSNLVYVKPDLSPEERAMESLLLKEWRSLIEMGVARQFSNKAYFVFNKLHAKIQNQQLQCLLCPETNDSNQILPNNSDPIYPQTQNYQS